MTTQPRRPELRSGAMLGGRYRVRRFLGAGAMGVVYEAETADATLVAIKLLFGIDVGARANDALARFKRESSVTAPVNSNHVVQVLDSGIDQDSGSPFFVMPLLTGLDLDRLIEKLGALHPTVATRIVVHACRGLAAAHAQGVIHRDIKPSNIFLDHTSDSSITAKLCDFGIAKALDSGEALTRTGSMLGTPLYMSPEQAMDAKRADARSDVWSLGMSLYHALAGEPAFGHQPDLVSLLLAIQSERPRPLQDLAPWIDPALAATVHGTLLADPGVRCPSADALLSALEPFAGGSADLGPAMLVPVPDELRAHTARRTELPQRWFVAARPSSIVAPPEQVEDPLIGVRLADRFLLHRLIGRGGMGAVYEGTSESGDRIAVKVVPPDVFRRSQDVSRRFVREARALSSITSPHVVHVHEVDTDPRTGLPFIVMELLNGADLDKQVKRCGALDPPVAVRLFVQLCRGLAAAHARGIVHRDIKPANLHLHELPAGQIVPKICDFGVAKRILAVGAEETTVDITRSGGVLGSPVYMSPEQARNAKTVDLRTDIWSLGLSLWEALCGRRPWEGYSAVGEIIIAIWSQEVRPLTEVAPWIDAGLARVVHRALRRDADERYATAEDFAAALLPYASNAETIDRSMLVPMTRPPRSAAPAVTPLDSNGIRPIELSTASSGVSSKPVVPLPPRRRRPAIAAAACIALGTAAGVLWYSRSGSAPPTVLPAAPTPSAAAVIPDASEDLSEPQRDPTPMTSTVWVDLRPSNAIVTVDGSRANVVNGRVEVTGSPGSSRKVVASFKGRSASYSVQFPVDGPVPELVVPDHPEPAKPSLDAQPPSPGAIPPPTPTPTPTRTTPPAPTRSSF